VLLLSAGILLVHVFAFFVYPHFKGRILNVILEREAQNLLSMPNVPQLRRSQVDKLPNEITFKNPEPLLAFLGALCLLGLLGTRPQYQRALAGGVFIFNLLPLLIFSSRAMPSSPVDYWNALLVGGPEQKAAMEATGRDLRLQERVPDRLDFVFPGTTAALYGVHSLRGYVSLTLRGAGQTEQGRDYNVLYESGRRQPEGRTTVLNTNQVRFVWANKQNRDVVIDGETLNSIRLRIAAGAAGELVRTDTYYPGWRVDSPASVTSRRNSDGFLAFSIPPAATDLALRYEPSGSNVTKPLSVTALAITGLLLASPTRRARRSVVSPISSSPH